MPDGIWVQVVELEPRRQIGWDVNLAQHLHERVGDIRRPSASRRRIALSPEWTRRGRRLAPGNGDARGRIPGHNPAKVAGSSPVREARIHR